MNDPIRILVVSRHEKDRERILADLSLQNNFKIDGTEKDEVSAIIKTEQLKPDVLIIDLEPAGLDVLELASIIHRKSPSTAIILFNNETINISKAFNTGIKGFISKDADSEEIVSAVFAAKKGSFYISKSFKKRLDNDIAPIIQPKNISLSLSPAERSIITGIARGFTDNQIADYLNYSAGTIRNIILSIKRKTKLKNRSQIAVFSLVYGLINPDLYEFLLNNDKEEKHPPLDN